MGGSYSRLEADNWCDANTIAYCWENYSVLRGKGTSLEAAFEDLKRFAILNGVPPPVHDEELNRWYCGYITITTCHLCCFWDNRKRYKNTVIFEQINDTYVARVLYIPL